MKFIATQTAKAVLMTLLGSSLLLGCGGGSSDSSSTPTTPTTPEPVDPTPHKVEGEHLSGGAASISDNTADAFSSRSGNMTESRRIAQFELGDDFFQNPWVAGSASTSSRDGLGGLFNNNACQDCHIRDGRGHAPEAQSDDFNSILFKAYRTQITQEQQDNMLNGLLANVGDSTLGGQVQHQSIANVKAEVTLGVTYTEQVETFSDGHQVTLRKPSWQIDNLYADQGYDFDADTLFSARVAPAMIGLGLVSLIAEQDILAKEDIADTNNDGISGKASWVFSLEDNHKTLGRYGWKAGQPSLLEQSAGAFVNDMGLTSRLHLQENCQSHQADCLAAPNGNGDSVNDYPYEVSDQILEAIAFYSSHLAVPERIDAYADNVQQGKNHFYDAGCVQCHTESYTTEFSSEHPELSEQVIFPYSDFLLHDMGEALADFAIDGQAGGEEQLAQFNATAREWRTPPLWGLGRAKLVDPKATFLHDGRARTIMEAILWHGGEAQASKDKVLQLSASERAELLSFLNDL